MKMLRVWCFCFSTNAKRLQFTFRLVIAQMLTNPRTDLICFPVSASPSPQTAHAHDKWSLKMINNMKYFSPTWIVSSPFSYCFFFLFVFLLFIVLNVFPPVLLTGAPFPGCPPQRATPRTTRTTSGICWGRPRRDGSSSNSTERSTELLSDLAA